ncbi:hypothetical protein [Actinomadura citrea]|uniref:Uncharacterized protein n=1 Tax=Actinomadura citrea TaxID=46158 RepID=A0A7Y9G7P9_9ACTN|nr:hypothetical protein [Actinomadura citrea]NYE11447.1 hypothetical protein [Actinomadura citrea]
MMMGIVLIICVANRSWLQAKAVNAIYENRPQIHAGKYFEPGATAVEDGVRQTAVLIKDKPYVRVTSPPDEWREKHEDAKCKGRVCTAPATHESFTGGGAIDIGSVLAGLLLCYFIWLLINGDDDYDDRYDRRYDRRYYRR